MQGIQNPIFKQFLIADSDFDRVSARTLLFEPRGDQGDIEASAHGAALLIKRLRRPQQTDTVCDGSIAQFLIF